MSVRAYRVNKIETEDSPTFNVWHDTDLYDFLLKDGIEYLNQDGGGYIEVSVERLRKAIVEMKDGKLEGSEDTIKALEKDADWAEKDSVDYIMYSCF